MNTRSHSDILLPPFDTFAPAIRALPDRACLQKADLLTPEFCLSHDGQLAMFYGPFDHVNPCAKVVLLGIAPSWMEMEMAYRAARHALREGLPRHEIGQRVKQQTSFAGAMRQHLVAMLNTVGLPACLGIAAATDLFTEHQALLHTTAAIRYPVFVNGRNYTGHHPPLLKTPVLRGFVEQVLAKELQQVPEGLIIPLGAAVAAALDYLADAGAMDRGRCLFGFPHPSGANGHRERAFAERREHLSLKLKEWFAEHADLPTASLYTGHRMAVCSTQFK
jgi:hypothetical protein